MSGNERFDKVELYIDGTNVFLRIEVPGSVSREFSLEIVKEGGNGCVNELQRTTKRTLDIEGGVHKSEYSRTFQLEPGCYEFRIRRPRTKKIIWSRTVQVYGSPCSIDVEGTAVLIGTSSSLSRVIVEFEWHKLSRPPFKEVEFSLLKDGRPIPSCPSQKVNLKIFESFLLRKFLRRSVVMNRLQVARAIFNLQLENYGSYSALVRFGEYQKICSFSPFRLSGE